MQLSVARKWKSGGGFFLLAWVLLALMYYLPSIDQPDCKTQAELLPMEYFRIEQFDNGRLQTLHGFHWPEQVVSSSSFIPERGDWFFVSYEGFGRRRVEAGDTLFKLYSRNWELKMLNLTGRLREEEARLKALQAGQKPETIQRVRQEQEVLKADLTLRQKQYDRAVALWKDSLISRAELEVAESRLQQSEERYNTAWAALKEVEAGVQPQSIRVQKALIAALKEQKEMLEKRSWVHAVRTPFSGVLHYNDMYSSPQVAVSQTDRPPIEALRRWEVWRDDSIVLRIPIPVNCLARLDEESQLELYLPNGVQSLQVQLQPEIWRPVLLNGREVIYYLAKTPWFEHPPTAGTYPCFLTLKKAGVWQYWKELFF